MIRHIPIDADEVKALRDATGCGIHAAKQIITGRKMREILARAKTAEDIRPILEQLIEDAYPDVEAPAC